MSENIMKTEPVIYTKDFDDYNNTKDNFVAAQELTVKITLNEYRNLVESKAKSQARIDEVQHDKYERIQKIDNLKEENAILKDRLYKLASSEDEPTKSVEDY
jgi:DNA-binding protein H-NS